MQPDNAQLCVFDLKAVQEIRCEAPGLTTILGVNPDAVIGVSSSDEVFRTWDLKTGRVVTGERIDEAKLTKAGTTLGPISISPDAKWEVRTNPVEDYFSLHLKSSAKALLIKAAFSRVMPLFSPGSAFLFVNGATPPVLKLEPDGRTTPALRRVDLLDATAAAFSPDEQIFAKASSAVTIWSLTSDRLIATLPQTDRVSLITFSPDSRFLAVSQPEIESVRVFERNGTEVARVHYPNVKYGAFCRVPGPHSANDCGRRRRHPSLGYPELAPTTISAGHLRSRRHRRPAAFSRLYR